MANFFQRTTIFFIITLTAYIYCQSQNEIKNVLEKKFNEYAGSFNTSELATYDIDEYIRQKCKTNANDSVYGEILEKRELFQECLMGFADAYNIQEELDEAAKTGSMELVFGKYCSRYPTSVKPCLDELHESVIPCFEDVEVPTINKTFFATDQVITFSCYKRGDRLAMFVAEGGVECLNETRDQIQDCVNSTFRQKIFAAMPILNEGKVGPLPLLILKEEHSKEYDAFHECVRTALESCEHSTPANVIDALFKYIRKLMFTTPRNAGVSLQTSVVLTTVLSLFILNLTRFLTHN